MSLATTAENNNVTYVILSTMTAIYSIMIRLNSTGRDGLNRALIRPTPT